MKRLIPLCAFFMLLSFEGAAQTEFIIEPNQSMIMTGKGPGQDATINPYFDQDCQAIVKNIGERSFSIRVQKGTEIIQEINIEKGQTKHVKLAKGYQLYLDPNTDGIAKASVDYTLEEVILESKMDEAAEAE